jgi:hypothetical protein
LEASKLFYSSQILPFVNVLSTEDKHTAGNRKQASRQALRRRRVIHENLTVIEVMTISIESNTSKSFKSLIQIPLLISHT